MYLKRIEAHGFKSFADKVTIELENKITGIVGPNGSGKSNVVDAVRWVLGEQSVKSLRGDGNMTDVIFSGSSSRNASSLASVTLVLDNTDHYFPLEQTEVALKRRVYKDGSNEYFLNNEKVRLKDIINILLDSGIAKESFNIISQGKIDEILSNKPEERRIIFEEAAGVLKYKRRKEEALRKLDRTHTNMNRINDIIGELEVQVEPLKDQKEKALRYQSIKEELEENEIALITNDITNLNYEYQTNKQKMAELSDEISKMNASNRLGEATILQYKNKITSLEESIKQSQESLLRQTKDLEQVNSRKAIILERQKYTVSDSKLHANLVDLKENELRLKTEIGQLDAQKEKTSKEVIDFQNKLEFENKGLEEAKKKRTALENTLTELVRKENEFTIKIESLRYSIDTNSGLPYAVKKVLENPKLIGIHDAIGNLIQVSEQYSVAISTVLGFGSTSLVVDNVSCAREAISYLKANNVGRATFFPMNIIQPKSVDLQTMAILEKQTGYLGLASDLIQFDSKYRNIILNQLGNVITVDTIAHANAISASIGHRYRIVTLEGELLHVGGSLTGGNTSKTHNIILEKYELEKLIRNQKEIVERVQAWEEKINAFDQELKALEDKIYLLNKEKLERQVLYDSFSKKRNSLAEEYKLITLDINGTNSILDKELSQEEQDVLALYYQTLEKKNQIELRLRRQQEEKESLSQELTDYELSLKKDNNACNEKNNEYRNLEILVNRLDVKLDNLLNTLSESYTLTYEAAVSKYKLDIPENVARNKVNSLKHELKEIGIVNLGAIEEFERVNTRYEFLTNQRDDLTKAENTLLEIIEEMDKILKRDFASTFEIIRTNFTKTFKELFKGGTADLKLTNPDNLLDTGIEIIACPPGKKLATISLLSGGEKTFTAISLLFAILKSKPVPFCILDEVEAALDDVNVDSFGQYVRNLKDKTQFIIITHKKKTMEYVDTLYGITMQESGVSKLVSVKLEEI